MQAVFDDFLVFFLIICKSILTKSIGFQMRIGAVNLGSFNIFFFQGWARRVESRGKFLFVHIGDGNSLQTVQAVVQRDICPKVPVGSAVDMVGDWVPSTGKQQAMELFASYCKVIGLQRKPVRIFFLIQTNPCFASFPLTCDSVQFCLSTSWTCFFFL